MVRKTGDMKIQYDPDFIKSLKKANVRVRKSFKEKIIIFSKNPDNPYLDNHQLHGKYQGYRSIDITADWRAVYEEINEEDEVIAYFIAIGTHEQLYK